MLAPRPSLPTVAGSSAPEPQSAILFKIQQTTLLDAFFEQKSYSFELKTYLSKSWLRVWLCCSGISEVFYDTFGYANWILLLVNSYQQHFRNSQSAKSIDNSTVSLLANSIVTQQ